MSIYSKIIDKNATIEDIERAREITAEKERESASMPINAGGMRIEDLDKDIIEVEGLAKPLVIRPKELYKFVNTARSNMLSNPRLSFLKKIAMFNKPIIFSYDKTTAWTDGCRIFVNPYFAHILSQNGMHRVNAYEKSEEINILRNTDGHDAVAEKCNRMETSLMEFILLHEVYHVIYDHISRAHTKIKNPSQQEWNKCNVCMDLEINRDIIAFFPEYGVINTGDRKLKADEFDNSAKDLDMIWWEDPQFYSKDGKAFSSEFYEVIYDNIKDGCADFLEDDMDHNTPTPVVTEEPADEQSALQKMYDEGYRYAMNKILEDAFNPIGIQL